MKLDKDQLEKIGYDSLAIAKMEFEKGVIPITVKRPMPIPEGIEQRKKEAA